MGKCWSKNWTVVRLRKLLNNSLTQSQDARNRHTNNLHAKTHIRIPVQKPRLENMRTINIISKPFLFTGECQISNIVPSHLCIHFPTILVYQEMLKIQDTRYFIFQIRAPGGHDTTFIMSTYTINKVKYNNYFITINHVCHRLEQREVIQARFS